MSRHAWRACRRNLFRGLQLQARLILFEKRAQVCRNVEQPDPLLVVECHGKAAQAVDAHAALLTDSKFQLARPLAACLFLELRNSRQQFFFCGFGHHCSPWKSLRKMIPPRPRPRPPPRLPTRDAGTCVPSCRTFADALAALLHVRACRSSSRPRLPLFFTSALAALLHVRACRSMSDVVDCSGFRGPQAPDARREKPARAASCESQPLERAHQFRVAAVPSSPEFNSSVPRPEEWLCRTGGFRRFLWARKSCARSSVIFSCSSCSACWASARWDR